MHLDIDRTCILCWSQVKTCQHLFFQCAITSCIWHVIRKWLGIRRSMTTLPSTLKWMKKEAQGTSWQSKAKKIALAHTVYQTQMTRNRKIFEDLKSHIDSIVKLIKTHVYKIMFSFNYNILIHFKSLTLSLQILSFVHLLTLFSLSMPGILVHEF